MVFKCSLSRGELLHDFLEAGFLSIRKVDPGQAKIAQRLLDNTLLRWLFCGGQRSANCGIGLLQARVL